MSSYKEIWQEFYETAQEAGLSDEDAGCEANAKLADYESSRLDDAWERQKDERHNRGLV